MNPKLSNIGSRGLVVYKEGTKTGFKYITEADWRAKGQTLTTPALQDLARLHVLVAPSVPNPAQGQPLSYFVNFDMIAQLNPVPAAPATPGAVPPKLVTGPEWSLIVNDKGTYTELPDALFDDLDAGSQGNAAVLVRRGALVASIPPNNIPSGSFCVLVNLTGLAR
ncbi:MAG TPA: hypothetical protein VGM06_01295 [Polyangiaceae bacterium]|jgi:hypothetical protein